jgi:hypothetical protein
MRAAVACAALVALALCCCTDADTMASLDAVDSNGAIPFTIGKMSAGMDMNAFEEAQAAKTALHDRKKQRMSLVELRERSVAAATGQEVMTDEMQKEAKKQFLHLATKFKGEKLKATSIATIRLAQQVMMGEGLSKEDKRKLGEGAGADGDMHVKEEGSGLDLIFYKLNELKAEIENEQKTELARISEIRKGCANMLSDTKTIIEDAMTNMADNHKTVQTASSMLIPEQQTAWEDSVKIENDEHFALNEMQVARDGYSAGVRAEVDEKTKAVDVLVKAAFLVCERFPRYKPTAQCKEIISQPDIDEPQRYETLPKPEAKEATQDAHAPKLKDSPDDNPWYIKWDTQMERDLNKVGHKDPEELMGPSYPATAPDPNAANVTETSAQLETQELIDVGGADVEGIGDEVEEETYSLSEDEQRATDELEALGKNANLQDHYTRPLIELGEAIKSGNTRRSRSIVEILLEILAEIRAEIALAKKEFQIYMDEKFDISEAAKAIMAQCIVDQADAKTEMTRLKALIDTKIGHSNDERNKMLKTHKSRTEDEQVCWDEEEQWGITEAINLEDLENLIKLKSLLRGLYEKKMPKNCKKFNGVMCTSSDAGWCVYIQEKASMGSDQRCSCNVGFYGEKCEFRMCPGLGQTLYRAPGPDAPDDGSAGVCSERGDCDPISGTCSCHTEETNGVLSGGFYHGPKNACEYKYAPISKNGVLDNLCSGRGEYDHVRGRCNCEYDFHGSSCQEKKCYNSLGLKFEGASAQACDGHGACNTETGLCYCEAPYYHDQSEEDGTGACDKQRCQDNCNGRGNCNTITGKCACTPGTKYAGEEDACRWHLCNDGDGCGGSANGWCNRMDGKCLCMMGFSGYKCDKDKRCAKKTLNEPEMNWWTVWDKPGWLVCPKGQLIYQLERSLCEALSCLDSGSCAAACEGDEHVYQLRHCYHDLRWYLGFDEAGWSKCLDDYFVAGLFRSCESLYCLNMAKCCSLKEARQPSALCGSVIWSGFDATTGMVQPQNVPDNTFITGFRRAEGHTLSNIKDAAYCGWVRGY